jgi:hypothetical protein
VAHSDDGFKAYNNQAQRRSLEILKDWMEEYSPSHSKTNNIHLMAQVDPMFSGTFLIPLIEDVQADLLILGIEPQRQFRVSRMMDGWIHDFLRSHSPVPILDPLGTFHDEAEGREVLQRAHDIIDHIPLEVPDQA